MTPKELGAMPAMPCEITVHPDGSVHGIQTGNARGFAYGLTIRQQFAIAAMQGLLSCGRTGSDVAENARSYADKLLAELCKEPT